MKYLISAIVLLVLSASAFADQLVHGYYRRNGTYVAPYHRTAPNQYRYDNYSSQGNVNPYTGRAGHQPNEFSTPPVYNKSYGGTGFSSPTYGAPSLGSPYGTPSRRTTAPQW